MEFRKRTFVKPVRKLEIFQIFISLILKQKVEKMVQTFLFQIKIVKQIHWNELVLVNNLELFLFLTVQIEMFILHLF